MPEVQTTLNFARPLKRDADELSLAQMVEVDPETGEEIVRDEKVEPPPQKKKRGRPAGSGGNGGGGGKFKLTLPDGTSFDFRNETFASTNEAKFNAIKNRLTELLSAPAGAAPAVDKPLTPSALNALKKRICQGFTKAAKKQKWFTDDVRFLFQFFSMMMMMMM